MNAASPLLLSPLLLRIEKRRDDAASAWKKAGRRLTPANVHELRVAARRLSASLSLLHSILDGDDDVAETRRQLKRLRKRLGPLRDLQVRISLIRKWAAPAAIKRYRTFLKRREKRERKRVLQILTRRRKRKHLRLLLAMAERTASSLEKTPPAIVIDRVSAFVQARENELKSALANLVASDPASLHALRISAKRLRYALESAEPLTGPETMAQLELSRRCQGELGTIRDLQLLDNGLQSWARKQDAPTRRLIRRLLHRLSQRRARLTERFLETLPVQTNGKPG